MLEPSIPVRLPRCSKATCYAPLSPSPRAAALLARPGRSIAAPRRSACRSSGWKIPWAARCLSVRLVRCASPRWGDAARLCAASAQAQRGGDRPFSAAGVARACAFRHAGRCRHTHPARPAGAVRPQPSRRGGRRLGRPQHRHDRTYRCRRTGSGADHYRQSRAGRFAGRADPQRTLGLGRPQRRRRRAAHAIAAGAGQPDCAWRRQALDALDRIGRGYRIAYSSEQTSGQEAAMIADLAIAPYPASLVRPPCSGWTGSTGYRNWATIGSTCCVEAIAAMRSRCWPPR